MANKLKQVWEGVKKGAKEAVGAMNRNAFGSMGNAAASNIAHSLKLSKKILKLLMKWKLLLVSICEESLP